MDFMLELVLIPVTDVDRAKAFYVEKVGFNLDVDHQPNDEFRVVQMTPPGSACSITIGKGITDATPGSYRGPTWSSPTSRPPVPSSSSGAWRSARSGISRPGGWEPGPDPSTATTTRSPTSATPTATPGSCRSQTRRPGGMSSSWPRFGSTAGEGALSSSPAPLR